MTPTPIEVIRQACIRANPEIDTGEQVSSRGATIHLADVLLAMEKLCKPPGIYAVSMSGTFLEREEIEHTTDMPHCWCNPKKEVQPNGDMVLTHMKDISARPFQRRMLSAGVSWNLLQDSLESQSSETLAFLASLLGE